MLLASHSASAVDHVWVPGTTGDFATAANWAPATVPGAGDNTFVNNGTCNITSSQSTFDCNAGNTNGTTGTYTMTGASTVLSVNSWFRYGIVSGGTGTFNLNAGTLNTSTTQTGTNLNLGEVAGGTGNLNINGGTYNANSNSLLRIGVSGAGNLTITSGTFNYASTVTYASIGTNSGAVGVMTVSGGSFVNGNTANALNVSDNAGSTGTLNVNGTGLVNLKGGVLNVGKTTGATGTVNLGNGTAYNGTTTTATIQTGQVNGGTGTGTFNFNGGRLLANAANATFFGTTAVARTNVRNGGAFMDTNGAAVTVSQALLHSNVAGDNATDGGLTKLGLGLLTLTGANTYTGNTNINAGVLQFNAGALPATGLININSGGALNAAGVFTNTNVTGILASGRVATTSTGAIALTGSSSENIDFNTPGYTNLMLGASVASTYTGTLTPNGQTYRLGGGGATLTVPGVLADVNGQPTNLAVGATGATGTVLLNNAETFTGATTITGATLQLGDGTTDGSLANTTGITDNGTLVYNIIGSQAVGVNITGTGALTKSGAGTLSLSGANVLNGPTNVNAGTLAITGGSLSGGTVNPNIVVNNTGTGTATLTQSGGTVTGGTGEVWVGNTAGSTGVYNISAGTLTDNNWLAIGRSSATGTLNISGTGNVIKTGVNGGNITLAGIGTTQTATINQNNGSLTNTATQTWIGETGIGIYNMSGGTASLGAVLLGQAGGSGTLNLQNAGAASTGTLSNGGGGEQMTATVVTVGNAGAGVNTVNLDGGTLVANQVIGGASTGAKTFNFNGGTLRAGAASTAFVAPGTATPAMTANVRNGGAIIDTNGFNDTITQALIHSAVAGDNATDGGLAKNGAGTLTLTGANTYTGATNVNAGTLVVDRSGTNAGAIASSSAVNVGGGGTLLTRGAVTLNGPVTLTGGATTATKGGLTLIDQTINTVTLNNNLVLGGGGNGAILGFDLSPTSGSSDLINVSGTVTPSGQTTVNLSGNVGSGTSTYTLLTATGGGLNPGGTDFTLGTKPAGFNQYSLANTTANSLILSVTANATVNGNEYWTGAASRNNGDAANQWGFGAGLAVPASNWSTDLAGTADPLQVPGATTDVVFTATNATPSTGTALNTQLDGAYIIRSLTFDVPASTTIASTTIDTNGNLLTLGANGLTLAATSNSSGTISGTGTVVLNGSQAWANNSANALTVSTGVRGNAVTGTNTLTFQGSGSGLVTLGGVLGNGALGGNLGLIVSKTGGVLALNAANTFTGGVTLNSGTVRLGNAGALNSTTPNTLTFGAGSTGDLQLGGNSVSLAGFSTNATAGTPVIENASATAATLTDVGATTSDTYAGVLQDGAGGGALTLTKTGSNTNNLTLSGANTFTGNVNITNGAVTITNSSALGVGPKTVNINNGTAGNDSLHLNSGGGADITLASNLTFNTSNTSGTVSNANGTIFNDAGNNTIASAFNLTAGGGGTAFVSNSGTLTVAGTLTSTTAGRTVTLRGNANGTLAGNIVGTTTNTVNLIKDVGTGIWTITSPNSTVTSIFENSGTIVLDTGGKITTTTFSSIGQNSGDNATLNIQGTGQLVNAGDFNVTDLTGSNATVNLSGSGVLKVNALFVGKGTGSTTGAATTGTFNQTGGAVSQNATGNDWRIGGGNIGTTAAVGVYNLSAGTFDTGASNFQVGAYGIGTFNQTGGTVTSNAFTDSGRFAGGVGNINVSGGTFTQTNAGSKLIDGEAGMGTITVNGTGTVSSVGGLVMGLATGSGGTFNLGVGGKLTTAFTSGAATPGTASVGASTFNFDGGTLQDNATNTAANNAAFMAGLTTTNVRNGGAIIDTNGNTATIAQVLKHSAIAGDNATDGGLTKTGAGTLTVTGDNTYTGTMTVSGGTLALKSANPDVVNIATVVNGAGTTNVASATQGVLQLAQSNQLSDAAPVTLNGGTINTQQFSEGAVGAPGIGTLALTNPNGTFSFLDYGTGNAANGISSTLAFANSAATFGTGQLQVVNYEYDFTGAGTPFDHLYFGTDSTGLTAQQLGQISFVNVNGVAGNNYAAQMLTSGEVSIAPTPEPGGLIPLVIGIAGTGVLVARRRRKSQAEEAAREMAEAV